MIQISHEEEMRQLEDALRAVHKPTIPSAYTAGDELECVSAILKKLKPLTRWQKTKHFFLRKSA